MSKRYNNRLTYEDRIKIINGELYQEIYTKEKDNIDRCSVGWSIDSDILGHFRQDDEDNNKSAIGSCELIMSEVSHISEEDLKKLLEKMKIEGKLMTSTTYMKPCDVKSTEQK